MHTACLPQSAVNAKSQYQATTALCGRPDHQCFRGAVPSFWVQTRSWKLAAHKLKNSVEPLTIDLGSL